MTNPGLERASKNMFPIFLTKAIEISSKSVIYSNTISSNPSEMRRKDSL